MCYAAPGTGVRHSDGRLRLITDSALFRWILRAAGLEDVFELHPRLPRSLNGAGD